MKSLKHFAKKIIPAKIRDFLREHHDYVRDRISGLGKKELSTSYRGNRVYFSPGMAIVARLRDEGGFENELCDAIIEELRKYEHPVFLDIGANIGLITLAITANVPTAHVHAFEPGPRQAKLLKRTLRENSLQDRADLHTIALGETQGTVEFFTHSSRHVSKDGFKDTGRGGPGTSIKVPVTTLDAWWKSEGKPLVSVIKIDTEGAEALVLQGASECLRETRPTIFLEIDLRNLAPYGTSPDALHSWFTVNGYVLSSLDGIVCSLENLRELLVHTDTFVARPKLQ